MDARSCELADKLTIQMLELIERDVSNRIYLEKQMNNGQLLLAKSRFSTSNGQNSISAAQLPSEDSDFKALSTVERQPAEAGWVLEKQHSVDKDSGHVDPLRWFGVLVPRCLQLARDMFRNCLFLAVEGANIRKELQTTIKQLLWLRAREAVSQ